MSSKRDLKKQIKYACGELAWAAMIMRESNDCVDKAAADTIIGHSADLQADTLPLCSFSFDKIQSDFADVHAYRQALHAYRHAAYHKVKADFDEAVNAIVKSINALVPAEARKSTVG